MKCNKGFKDRSGGEENDGVKESEDADRWRPRRSATEAHAAAVHYGRTSDTHASAVDTSQYAPAAREEGVRGVETRA